MGLEGMVYNHSLKTLKSVALADEIGPAGV
jgi:hypothetical protein